MAAAPAMAANIVKDLNKKWGIVDVDDCVNGARYLAERGEVDGKRLIITGGSAGGYTTLCALNVSQYVSKPARVISESATRKRWRATRTSMSRSI